VHSGQEVNLCLFIGCVCETRWLSIDFVERERDILTQARFSISFSSPRSQLSRGRQLFPIHSVSSTSWSDAMHRITRCLFLVFLVLGALSSSPAKDTGEAAVRSADSLWATAIASKSLEQTVTFYDPEAVTAGSAMFPARGPEAFRKQWKSLFAQPDFSLSWDLKKVVVTESGTIAYTSGSWRGTKADEFGPYLAVWRKQPTGEWKVLIDAAWFCTKKP
jgi:ketosteroid isomerase-like protein